MYIPDFICVICRSAHHASKKHLGRYVDEFTFRLNEGNVKHHTPTRLESLICAGVGKRLTYANLIA
jgi:hypothetical protein